MKRGDVVTVAISGDYGKPRPAVVNQTDFLTETDSVLVCLITSTLRKAPLYRLTIPGDADTGLRAPSQIMVDKIVTMRRDRCGGPIGQIDAATLTALSPLLAFVTGITG